jgi:AraC family transcriptional regulator
MDARSHGARVKGALTPLQRDKLVEYVAEHLTSDITLAELAGVIDVSPGHFARMFRRTFDTSPYRYIIEQRIADAQRIIAEGRMSILEIALTVGFSSQSHFTVAFRKVTGMTPSQFRSKL